MTYQPDPQRSDATEALPIGDSNLGKGSNQTKVSPATGSFSDKKACRLCAALGEGYPSILTPEQAASLMQVPLDTIYDWSSRGLLRNCKLRAGKHLRILRDCFLQLFL